MSDGGDTPIINDAITSDDAGFSSDAGNQTFEEDSFVSEESESSEETPIASEGEGEVAEVQAESDEEFQQEVEEAIEEGATEEEVQEMVRKYQIKVNGEERTVELDLDNEADIIRKLQMAEAGQAAMQRQREIEKAYDREMQRLKDNPWDLLKEQGFDPDELAEARLREKVEEMKKSPEQRQREALEAELAQAREELRRQQEEAEQARFTQLQQEEAVKLEQEIESALDAHTTLPKSPRTIQRIADTMLWAMEEGFEDVSVEDVIPTVEAEIRDELRGFMDELPEEMMEAYIGKQNLEKLRKKRLNTHKPKPNNTSNIKPTSEAVQPKKDSKREKIRSKDYFKNLGR